MKKNKTKKKGPDHSTSLPLFCVSSPLVVCDCVFGDGLVIFDKVREDGYLCVSVWCGDIISFIYEPDMNNQLCIENDGICFNVL